MVSRMILGTHPMALVSRLGCAAVFLSDFHMNLGVNLTAFLNVSRVILGECSAAKLNGSRILLPMPPIIISKKSNLHPGHMIYLIPRMPKIITRIQAALVAPHVSPDVPL